METLLSISIGIGLAAACGFRIFVPLLALSLAAHAGHVTLAPSFAWMGTTPALVTFAVATVLEIAAYYVPWLDNCLDSLATPAAIVAGTVVTASVITNMSPYLQWTLALVAGGTVAGLVQGSTVATRLASTSGSGGLANPVVSTAELGMAGIFSVVSVAWPLVAVFLVIGLLTAAMALFWRRYMTPPCSPPRPG